MAGEKEVTLSAAGELAGTITDVKVWTTKLDHNLDKPLPCWIPVHHNQDNILKP